MPLSSIQINSWSGVIFYLGLVFAAIVVMGFTTSAYLEMRKTKLAARQQDDLRQLVHRYEELAEKTLDAQQRTAADVAALRARATSIEQILRTVE
jgi:hypothetical protein